MVIELALKKSGHFGKKRGKKMACGYVAHLASGLFDCANLVMQSHKIEPSMLV